ncbi:hypothetical protein [Gluconobacter kanchanaburiensis]|nr:hypothetical protein [Gluconobacter kanchanaburiensis]
MEGKELVLHYNEGKTEYCVITFPGRFHTHEAKEKFFGGNIFAKNDISSIGLTTKIDNWFICDEIDEFIEKIKEISSKYTKIVAIGPSMGSYPAIKYSKKLNIHRILSLAPKWTIDPKLIHSEPDKIRDGLLSDDMNSLIENIFSDEKSGHCIESGDVNNELIVCYDTYRKLDKFNVQKLRTIINFEEVLFPKCGHVIIDQLQGSENLLKIVHSLVYDDIKTTCELLTKIRRSHKNKIKKYYDVAHEKHPYYCFLMMRKFIDGKFPGYKEFLLKQNTFSNLMDKLVRNGYHALSKEVEFYFRNKIISESSLDIELEVGSNYRADIFNIMDYHGGRLEYSLRAETLFASGYFFGGRDLAVNVFARKVNSDILLVTIFDGQYFYLQFENGKIRLTRFMNDPSVLKLSPKKPPQQNDFFYENNFMKDIFRVVTPYGYMMSPPDGNIVFDSPNALPWESFSLHPPMEDTPPPAPQIRTAPTLPEEIRMPVQQVPKKKARFLSRFMAS